MRELRDAPVARARRGATVVRTVGKLTLEGRRRCAEDRQG